MVHCNAASKTTAPAAYIAKFRTAGIPTTAPSEKATVSETAERRIDGPILPRARPTRCSMDSSAKRVFMRWNSWTRRNILSTPTARTKKGITSAMIKVVLTPKAENMPTEDIPERRTMIIPKRPSVNFEETREVREKEKIEPSDREAKINMKTYE